MAQCSVTYRLRVQNAGRILRDASLDLIAPTAEAASIIRKYNLSIYKNGDEFKRTRR